ncbi:MAG: hypothetical protein JXA37_14605, partial [Chloroflexia bacterium]|nr:hypothetical protein [Chloroflexia bacterium]
GYTPYVVAGVWVGNNNNEPMTLNCAPRSLARVGMPSSRTAGRVWRYFMENLFNAEDNLLTYFDDETAAAMFGQGQLRYAHYDGESWQIETVDQEGWVGAHTSLALDRTGYPHISYCSYGQFSESCTTLKYAHYDGASWQIETVDEANTGAYSSLALDRGGHPHISYYSEPDAELFYATHDGSRWQITRLDQDLGQDGGYTALALDRRGRPHISYYDGMSRSIKYASLSGSDWKIETIEEGVPHGALSMDTSLALDRVDQPHVAYPDVAHGQLKHAYRSGPVWRVEVVDSSERLGDYAAMVLDQEDQPHISYCLYDPDLQACTTLKYAHYNREEQGWQIEIIEEGAEVGDYNRIALDDEDRPHISYYDTDYQDLKYTYGSDSGWRTQWLDEEDWMGRYSSIQLDAQGRPHISYLGAPEPDLRDILRDEEGKLQYDFDRPSGVVNVEVCALSGKLPGPHCPVTSEVFVEGNQPRETCSIHKALTVVQVPGSDPPQYCLPAPGVVYPPELFQEVVFTDLHSVARIEEIAGLEEWMVEVGLPRVPTDYCPAEWGTVPGGPGQPPDNRWAGLMREISIPWRYQGIDGPIEIRGSANLVSSRPQDQFAGYRLEWGLKILATWPTEWNLIYESNVPVQNGVLAYWDPGNLPDGSYALRLTVLTKEGRPKFDGDAPGHTYRPFYIDRGGIFARIIEPLPGSLLTRSKTTIAVKVEGVAPARRVDFFYDGIFIGTAVTNTVMPLSERVYTITWPVRPGEHDLTVEVVNTAGRKTSSQPVLVFGQPPQGALPQQPARVVAVQPSPALPPRDVRRSPR